MNSIDQILQEAVQLPEDQRLTLANRILALSEPYAKGEVGKAWDAEIRDRIARYDRGELKSRSATEVFSDLDRLLKK